MTSLTDLQFYTIFCFHPESSFSTKQQNNYTLNKQGVHVLLHFWILKFNSSLNGIRLLKTYLSVKIRSIYENHFRKKTMLYNLIYLTEILFFINLVIEF